MSIKPQSSTINNRIELSLPNEMSIKKFSTMVGSLSYRNEVNIDI